MVCMGMLSKGHGDNLMGISNNNVGSKKKNDVEICNADKVGKKKKGKAGTSPDLELELALVIPTWQDHQSP